MQNLFMRQTSSGSFCVNDTVSHYAGNNLLKKNSESPNLTFFLTIIPSRTYIIYFFNIACVHIVVVCDYILYIFQ